MRKCTGPSESANWWCLDDNHNHYDVTMIIISTPPCVARGGICLLTLEFKCHLRFCSSHRQGMQRSYETYSNFAWPFCQSNCTPVSPGHRNDKSYLFLPNHRRKRRSLARVDLRAAMFSFPSCIAVDSSARLFHDLLRNHAGHHHAQKYARNRLGCGTY